MEATRKFQAFTASDVVEDRSNTEMYDLDGWPTKNVYFVTAENPHGHVFRHCHRFDTEAEAAVLADRVNAHLTAFPCWTPEAATSLIHWDFDRLAYGSEAWQTEGGDAAAVRQELDMEAEAEFAKY